MEKSHTVIAGLVVFLLAAGGAYYVLRVYGIGKPWAPVSPTIEKRTKKAALSPEVETVIERKMQLVVELAQDPIITAEAKKSNEKNKSLTSEQILR